MASRRPMKRGKSERLFSKTAGKTQLLNLRATPMRGGFRI